MPDTLRGRDVVEAFHYVRDIYRNVSRILQAADPLLNERGYRVHPWSSVWTPADKVTTPEKWAPYWAVRQYYRPSTQNREILTLGAVMWDPRDEGMDIPILLASRMQVVGTAGMDPLWVALLQHWTAAPPDGEPRAFTVPEALRLPANDQAKATATLGGAPFLSVAIPLLDVTSLEAVEHRLLTPLLAIPWELA